MLDRHTLQKLEAYIEEHLMFVLEKEEIIEANFKLSESIYAEEEHTLIEEFLKTKRQATFQQLLFGFIDAKGLSDSDVYKKAGIDRRLFSKIRSNSNYKIGKNTAIALAIALELNKQEVDQLLNTAGYSLSDSEIGDLSFSSALNKKSMI